MTHKIEPPRCAWASSPDMIDYHDREWGVAEHEDRMLFELLTLEGAQAGLSWATILRKRTHYRDAFAQFDIAAVAAFDADDVARCLADSGIVRNRLKVASAVSNARAMLSVIAEFGSFDRYIWQFTDGRQVITHRADAEPLPVKDPLSERVSRDLLARGFKFVGPTIVYSYLQAIGVIDDHYASCYRAMRMRAEL